VEVWENYGESFGNVFINISSNHGYYDAADNYLLDSEVPILGSVVNTLWKEKRIEERLFIFNIKSNIFSSTTEGDYLAISDDCVRLSGAAELSRDRTPVGDKCYVANISDSDMSHKKLLLAVLAAQKIQGDVERINLSDLESYEKEFEEDLTRFLEKTITVDPKWSPDGKYLLQNVWKDGVVSYEVIDTESKEMITLPDLGNLPMAEPEWSYDSRFVAYVSEDGLMIYDMTDGSLDTIDLRQYYGEGGTDSFVLSFSPDEDILFFSFDVNYFERYEAYLWNGKDGGVSFYGDENTVPWLDRNNLNVYRLGIEEPYNVVQAFANPVYDKVALVTKGPDGLTGVQIIDKENEVSQDNGDSYLVEEEAAQSQVIKESCGISDNGEDANRYLIVISIIELLIIMGLSWRLITKKR